MEELYKDDLHGIEFFNDVMDCRMLLKDREGTKITNARDLFQFII